MAPGIIAQQSTAPVIGWLSSASAAPHWTAAFHDGLKSFGYVAERNVTIGYRRAEGQYEQQPALAADLVARQVAVIVLQLDRCDRLCGEAGPTDAAPILRHRREIPSEIATAHTRMEAHHGIN
jgi:hypothetical protein